MEEKEKLYTANVLAEIKEKTGRFEIKEEDMKSIRRILEEWVGCLLGYKDSLPEEKLRDIKIDNFVFTFDEYKKLYKSGLLSDQHLPKRNSLDYMPKVDLDRLIPTITKDGIFNIMIYNFAKHYSNFNKVELYYITGEKNLGEELKKFVEKSEADHKVYFILTDRSQRRIKETSGHKTPYVIINGKIFEFDSVGGNNLYNIDKSSHNTMQMVQQYDNSSCTAIALKEIDDFLKILENYETIDEFCNYLEKFFPNGNTYYANEGNNGTAITPIPVLKHFQSLSNLNIILKYLEEQVKLPNIGEKRDEYIKMINKINKLIEKFTIAKKIYFADYDGDKNKKVPIYTLVERLKQAKILSILLDNGLIKSFDSDNCEKENEDQPYVAKIDKKWIGSAMLSINKNGEFELDKNILEILFGKKRKSIIEQHISHDKLNKLYNYIYKIIDKNYNSVSEKTKYIFNELTKNIDNLYLVDIVVKIMENISDNKNLEKKLTDFKRVRENLLNLALIYKKVDIAKLLIKKQEVKVDKKCEFDDFEGSFGKTAFNIAIRNNNLDVAAKIYKKFNYNEKCSYDSFIVFEINNFDPTLKKEAAQRLFFHYAKCGNNTEDKLYYLLNLVNPNERNINYSATPFEIAIYNKNIKSAAVIYLGLNDEERKKYDKLIRDLSAIEKRNIKQEILVFGYVINGNVKGLSNFFKQNGSKCLNEKCMVEMLDLAIKRENLYMLAEIFLHFDKNHKKSVYNHIVNKMSEKYPTFDKSIFNIAIMERYRATKENKDNLLDNSPNKDNDNKKDNKSEASNNEKYNNCIDNKKNKIILLNKLNNADNEILKKLEEEKTKTKEQKENTEKEAKDKEMTKEEIEKELEEIFKKELSDCCKSLEQSQQSNSQKDIDHNFYDGFYGR